MTVHTNERCKFCKLAVQALLVKVFGSVEANPRVPVGTVPKDYQAASCHQALTEIHELLKRHRGFSALVRAKTLPPSDFYLPTAKCLVEFDESQHFTVPRRLALEHYPDGLQLAFSKSHWLTLCDTIRAVDNDPPYRDEQRAWYDTLRDFLPLTLGFRPTIRLYAGATHWCELDPQDNNAVSTFQTLLGERTT